MMTEEKLIKFFHELALSNKRSMDIQWKLGFLKSDKDRRFNSIKAQSASLARNYKRLIILLFDGLGLEWSKNQFLGEYNQIKAYDFQVKSRTEFQKDFLGKHGGLLYEYIELLSIYFEVTPREIYTEALINIIQGSPKLLQEFNLDVSTEPKIQKAMQPIIKAAYPQTMREVKTPSVMKTFKIDFSIPNLKIGIELKLVKTKRGIDKFIGGIFEDAIGYNGDSRWDHFYAVIYTHGNIITQREVEEEFKHKNILNQWTPFILPIAKNK